MHNTYSDSYPTQQSKAMYNEGFQKVGAGMVVMGKYIDNDPKRRRVTRETHIELHRKRTKYAIRGRRMSLWRKPSLVNIATRPNEQLRDYLHGCGYVADDEGAGAY